MHLYCLVMNDVWLFGTRLTLWSFVFKFCYVGPEQSRVNSSPFLECNLELLACCLILTWDIDFSWLLGLSPISSLVVSSKNCPSCSIIMILSPTLGGCLICVTLIDTKLQAWVGGALGSSKFSLLDMVHRCSPFSDTCLRNSIHSGLPERASPSPRSPSPLHFLCNACCVQYLKVIISHTCFLQLRWSQDMLGLPSEKNGFQFSIGVDSQKHLTPSI